MVTPVSAAMFGTLDTFLEIYEPGTANKMWSAGPLLAEALVNHDPVNRFEIATFLLDEGADPAWRRSDGMTLGHVMLNHFYKEVISTDLQLFARLLDSGSDPNSMMTKRGTLIQDISRSYIDKSQVYDVVFAREGLDLFTMDRRGLSTYITAWKGHRTLPELWARVQQYIVDHALLIPEDQQDLPPLVDPRPLRRSSPQPSEGSAS
jgi:hypothetical protein